MTHRAKRLSHGRFNWSCDTTTTMGEEGYEHAHCVRSVDPFDPQSTARLRALRLSGDYPQEIAWLILDERNPGEGPVPTYVFDLAIGEDDIGGFGDVVATVSPPASRGATLIGIQILREQVVRAVPTPRTVLGKRLWDLRRKIVATGHPLFDWDDVTREIHERRGESDAEGLS